MELGFYIANLTWLNLTSAERFRRHIRWESNGATFSLASLEAGMVSRVLAGTRRTLAFFFGGTRTPALF